jgi:hypothetical protein
VLTRARRLYGLKRQERNILLTLLALAALIQGIASLLPWLNWLTWPWVVFCGLSAWHACTSPKAVVGTSSRSVLTGVLASQLRRHQSNYALFLYGLLGLLVQRGSAEALRILPSVSPLFPGATASLLPFSLSDAIAVLYVAICSAHLAADDKDPLIALSKAFRELLSSPLSWCVLIGIQALALVGPAVWLAGQFHAPALTSVLVHAVFASLSLAWVVASNSQQAAHPL